MSAALHTIEDRCAAECSNVMHIAAQQHAVPHLLEQLRMPRITFTYEVDADGDLTGRIDDIAKVPDTFWSGRSRSAIAKELVKRALVQVETDMEAQAKPRKAARQ